MSGYYKENGGKTEYAHREVVPCRYGYHDWRIELYENYIGSRKNGLDNSYVVLKKDPKNRVDPNAIQVWVRGEFYGQLGFIGKEYAVAVGKIMANGDYRVDGLGYQDEYKGEFTLEILYN